MIVANKRGKIVLLNMQVESQFGYSRDGLLAEHFCQPKVDLESGALAGPVH